jgi:uncharacterized ParB-like nuclease family protein
MRIYEVGGFVRLVDLRMQLEKWDIGKSFVSRQSLFRLSKLQRPVEALNYTHVLDEGRPTEWYDGERCENEEKGIVSICLSNDMLKKCRRFSWPLDAQGLWTSWGGCHRLSSRAGRSCHDIQLHQHNQVPVSIVNLYMDVSLRSDLSL